MIALVQAISAAAEWGDDDDGSQTWQVNSSKTQQEFEMMMKQVRWVVRQARLLQLSQWFPSKCIGCIVGFLALAGSVVADDLPLRVGVSSRVITPSPLLPVSGGMGPTHPTTHALGDLTVRAVVLERDQTRLALVSVDALGFPSVLIDRVAKLVPAIPAENILVGATHTHSAPDFYAFPDGRGGHTGSLEYIEQVVQWMAAAINDAAENLNEARLRTAVGEVRGQVAYNYYAIELYDPRANVLQFVGKQGDVLATIVNYAIHPEVLGAEVGALSPDLIGPMCAKIEAQVGGMAMFMNGAQGGMITADNRDLNSIADPLRGRWNDKREWSECVRIGELLADEALRIIAPAPSIDSPLLSCHHRMVEFPVESDDLWGVIQYSPLKYPHNANRSISSRINLVQLGPTRIVTIPGEALPNIGFFLKRKMSGEQNLLFGLTNDAFGYILTEVDYASFPRYGYVTRVSLGEQTGEILMRNILELDASIPNEP
jgi:hypothetical protein